MDAFITSSGSEVVGNLYANQLFAELSGDMPDRHRNHIEICSRTVVAACFCMICTYRNQISTVTNRGKPKRQHNGLPLQLKSSNFKDLSGAQSRNRTSDTRIFNPQHHVVYQ